MKVVLIAAMATNRVIGRRGRLPWRLPADLAHFKSTTMGHHLIMGRKTFEFTGALPGRTTVVVSRGHPSVPDGVLTAASPAAALELAEHRGEDVAFVAGGGEIYRQTIARADRLELTLVDLEVEGDTYFPEIGDEWRQVGCRDRPADRDNPHRMSFLRYER